MASVRRSVNTLESSTSKTRNDCAINIASMVIVLLLFGGAV
jgi:hypothetical protein